MADALVVLVDDAHHVAAGKHQVPGVKQQRQRVTRVLHQEIDFLFRLDRGSHVVMVGDRHALDRAPFGEGGHLAAIGLDLVLREFRFGGERRRALALDRARRLAVDDARRPTALNNSICAAMRSFSCSMSPLSRRPENQPPQTRDSLAGEDRSEHLRVHRETAAGLHAGEAGDLVCRKHSSRLTSSLSSTRSSFHQPMGEMPSLAFIRFSHSDALFLAVVPCSARAVERRARARARRRPNRRRPASKRSRRRGS